MKNGDNFVHDIDNLSLLLQLDEILKHTKRPVNFDRPDNESVLKLIRMTVNLKFIVPKNHLEDV